MDAPSIPAGRADSDPSAASILTDQGDVEDTLAVLSGRAAHELSNWGRLPATDGAGPGLRGEPGQYRMNPEIGDGLIAEAYEWTKSGSLKERASWNTDDVLVMAGGPAETKGELSVCVPSGFPEDVEPSPQPVVDVEHSK